MGPRSVSYPKTHALAAWDRDFKHKFWAAQILVVLAALPISYALTALIINATPITSRTVGLSQDQVMRSVGGLLVLTYSIIFLFSTLHWAAYHRHGVSTGQADLAGQLISLSDSLKSARTVLSGASSDSILSDHFTTLVDGYTDRLDRLLAATEGLDGIGSSQLGGKLIYRLSAAARQLEDDISVALRTAKECEPFKRLENDSSRALARAILTDDH